MEEGSGDYGQDVVTKWNVIIDSDVMLHVISGDGASPPLSMMAAHKECCIVCLAHLFKSSAQRRLNSKSIKHVVPVLREASARSPSVISGVSDRLVCRLKAVESAKGSGSVRRRICPN